MRLFPLLLTTALLMPVSGLAQSPARTKRPARSPKRAAPPHIVPTLTQPPEVAPTLAQPAKNAPTANPPLLALARARALTYLDELPNFITTQITRRSVFIRGEWQPIDVLETTVNYERGTGETTRLISVNGNRPDDAYRKGKGAKAVGVLSSQLPTLFRPSSQTTFVETEAELYRGRPCRIYRYSVAKANSSYQLSALLNKKPPVVLTVGYSGRIWLDGETGYPLRVEKFADDIPPDFPISKAEVTVEYDWVTISGEQHWLPVTSESLTELTENRRLYLNVTEFRDYRKYDGDVKVVD